MPQFDFYSFSVQIFWFLLTFFSFYFFSAYFYLSNFAEVFKMREKLLKHYNVLNLASLKLNLFEIFFKR